MPCALATTVSLYAYIRALIQTAVNHVKRRGEHKTLDKPAALYRGGICVYIGIGRRLGDMFPCTQAIDRGATVIFFVLLGIYDYDYRIPRR